MLNLYAVTVWRAHEPRRCETVEVRTYSAKRAEQLRAKAIRVVRLSLHSLPT